jgi:Bacterial capsule synthesis protein PGA_cap
MTVAGAAETAREAASPSYVDTANGRVALVACASSLGAGWPAADPGPGVEGRPGVNALRFDTRYLADRATFEQVRRLAHAFGLANVERYELEMGYVPALADPERQFRLLEAVVERGAETRVETVPRGADLDRVLASVREAADHSDVVLVSLHTQEWLDSDEQPAQFARTFARACVDAGAQAVAMSGPHVLRGIELHRGAPILYSLGNIWFEYVLVERLPPDSFEQYGLSPRLGADAFADHALLGFRRDARVWETVVERCGFAGGRLRDLTLHPVTLGYRQPRGHRGRPVLASAAEAGRILERITGLSSTYATRIHADGEIGRVEL